MILSLTRMHFIRPRVTTHGKNNDFIEPTEAPGEGKRKPPSYDEDGEPKKAETAHPIKELIKKIFKIEEIDYKKFKKENKWAIRPSENKDKE